MDLDIARRALRGIAGAICLVSTMSLAISCAQEQSSDMVYEALERSALAASASNGNTVAGDSTTTLADVLSINPEVAGWLTVENTSISYPVVLPEAGTPRDWYLDHDVQGYWNPLGCPYIDNRSGTDKHHLLVYGHHVHNSDAMFSSIAAAYQEDIFEAIGSATWSTPDGETETFYPCMALNVESSYDTIQRFSFADQVDLQIWIGSLSKDAQAKARMWAKQMTDATRVLTLVTCSSEQPGQTWRTLVVFTDVEGKD